MGQFFIDLANKFIELLAAAISGILSLLPSSPFAFTESLKSDWVNAICWIFPIPGMITHLEAFLAAAAVWYAVRVALRWIKVAGS